METIIIKNCTGRVLQTSPVYYIIIILLHDVSFAWRIKLYTTQHVIIIEHTMIYRDHRSIGTEDNRRD